MKTSPHDAHLTITMLERLLCGSWSSDDIQAGYSRDAGFDVNGVAGRRSAPGKNSNAEIQKNGSAGATSESPQEFFEPVLGMCVEETKAFCRRLPLSCDHGPVALRAL